MQRAGDARAQTKARVSCTPPRHAVQQARPRRALLRAHAALPSSCAALAVLARRESGRVQSPRVAHGSCVPHAAQRGLGLLHTRRVYSDDHVAARARSGRGPCRRRRTQRQHAPGSVAARHERAERPQQPIGTSGRGALARGRGDRRRLFAAAAAGQPRAGRPRAQARRALAARVFRALRRMPRRRARCPLLRLQRHDAADGARGGLAHDGLSRARAQQVQEAAVAHRIRAPSRRALSASLSACASSLPYVSDISSASSP